MSDFNLIKLLDKNKDKNKTKKIFDYTHLELKIGDDILEILLPSTELFCFEQKISYLTNIDKKEIEFLTKEHKGLLLKGFNNKEIRID